MTWCKDIARDAAVRAAEDGRTGPLPTLEQAIARPFAEAAKRSVPVSKTGEGQSGMRTERITLEVTGALGWRVHVNGVDVESVRVVEEARNVTSREGSCDAQAASGGGDHFADASKMVEQPRGWLTGEEREAVDAARDYFDDDDHGDSECVFIARVLKQLLARSSPPEVVLRDFPPDTIRNLDWHYLAGWNQCMNLAKKAISAAGVSVKEVG